MARPFRHPLGSRVGRRIALVAVVSVLVPLALFGGVAFTRARTQVEAQEWQRLHKDTKTAALNGLARLKLLEEELRWLAALASTGPVWERRGGIAGMVDKAEALSVVPGPGRQRVKLKGDDVPPGMTGAEGRHLREVGVLLMRGADADSHWLIVTDQSGAEAAARIPAAAIFAFDDASPLPAEDVLCVTTVSAHIACSDGTTSTPLAVRAAGLPEHGQGSVDLGSATYFARTWALPLEAEYHAGVWTAVMLTPKAEANATLWQLERDLMLLTTASLVVVILAVLASVRRNLRPLAALEAAATRVGRRQFDVHLDLATGDEFETLAEGFNGMVAAIRAHVEDVKAFSVGAATALARTIDAKSPWTAGHSERVTAMSLEIARTLGLPESDLVILHRGGLLHDIGKLATPPEILDKPGRLTPEERTRIEQHPRDGVRILEPIADFAALLPIVLEHHERFDGHGYPDGKGGHEIHHLARVLAVADVYDALVSDRPYRPGLAVAAAVDHIRVGAGTHFDPLVVAAFLRVVAHGEPPSTLGCQHAADSARRALAGSA